MPKKEEGPSPARKPRKPSAANKAAKKQVPQQGDLFEEPSAAAVPARQAKPPVGKKTARAGAKTSRAPAPSRAVQPRQTVTSTKEYIQKIPYASVLVIGYVALVLAWDAFITVGDTRTVNWAVFLWRPAHLEWLLETIGVPHFLVGWMGAPVLAQMDLFKVVFWLVIPLSVCLWRIDLDYFRTRRVKPEDWWFLGGICLLAVAAIVSVKFIPVLAHQYRGLGQVALSVRMKFLLLQLFWVLSWLPGWEFMHRYFLLRRVSSDFPRFGWFLVPVAEGAYHLLKPWPEMLAMVVFSVVMTRYTLRRKNIVIPFLGHLAVEVFLIIGMLVW